MIRATNSMKAGTPIDGLDDGRAPLGSAWLRRAHRVIRSTGTDADWVTAGDQPGMTLSAVPVHRHRGGGRRAVAAHSRR